MAIHMVMQEIEKELNPKSDFQLHQEKRLMELLELQRRHQSGELISVELRVIRKNLNDAGIITTKNTLRAVFKRK